MYKALLMMAILLGGLCFAGGDAEKGKTAYATCVACHGANGEGNQILNSPSLIGQEDWYMVRQLKYFKDGIRGTNPKDIYGMQMRPMAMTLPDDATIENVVAYIKTLKGPKPKPTISGGDAAKGKTYYAVCVTCHGQNAEGLQAMNAPKLSNQQDWYMIRQIEHFKDGIRGADPKDTFGMQMRPMAMTLPDEQAIKDVVAYIMTLGK